MHSISWAPDGRRLVSGSLDYSARIRDVTSGSQIVLLPMEYNNHMTTAAWSPEGSLVAFGRESGRVELWDADTGKELAELERVLGWIDIISWSQNGNLLASRR